MVAGTYSAAKLAACAKRSKDKFCNLTTVSGDAISIRKKGNSLYVYDESGSAGRVTIGDVNQSNGVIHVVDSVLVPQ